MPLPAAILALDRPRSLDLVIVRGDGRAYPLELSWDDGSPVDLTGCTCTAAVHRQAGGDKICDLTITPVDLANGMLQVAYPATVSGAIAPPDPTAANREPALGIWYLRISAGGDPVTLITGNVTLLRPS